MATKFNVDFIMDFEGGNPTIQQFIEGFADGIKSGQVFSLQGHYGRTASNLIDNGLVTSEGVITDAGNQVIMDDGHKHMYNE